MPINTQKLFVSYARADQDFVLKLAKELRSAGIELWVDQLDIPKGARWDDEVENALRASPCMLLILSPTSVTSRNVKDELAEALDRNKTILPVLYQDCDIPFRLKRVQHIDFTASYAEGMQQLLDACKVAQPQQAQPSADRKHEAQQVDGVGALRQTAAAPVTHEPPGTRQADPDIHRKTSQSRRGAMLWLRPVVIFGALLLPVYAGFNWALNERVDRALAKIETIRVNPPVQRVEPLASKAGE
jgi:hypothetical protein